MKFIYVVAALPLVLVVAWQLAYPTYSWHEKMTVEVELDGKIYSGSSTIMRSTVETPSFLPVAGSRDSEMHGEAVVVQLPGERYLFALLVSNSLYATGVFSDKMDGAMREGGMRFARIISRLREKRDIPPKLYPQLVTFKDINDPESVQKVDPANFAGSFGDGVRLKRITLEITDELVTKGKMEKVLGWLGEYYNKRLDGNRYGTIRSDDRFANSLSAGSFDTEKN